MSQSDRAHEVVAQVSQPAVSPVSNRQILASSQDAGSAGRPADWKSAIQQIGNLRYASAYRFLAEVLLYPEDREAGKLVALAAEAGASCPHLRDAFQSVLTHPDLGSCDTYLETFEIGAKAPLYLGHYLFEEPKNCRGAALSGRNAYMIQLKNLFRHFGLQLHGGELPDFLPLLLDFLALTGAHPDQKRRRWMIKQFIAPALPAFGKNLREAGNVYSSVAGLLEQLINQELEEAWAPQAEPAAVVDESSRRRSDVTLASPPEIRNPKRESQPSVATPAAPEKP